MPRSKKTTGLAVAAGVLAMGAAAGVTQLAAADPTPTPSPSATPSTGQPPAGRGHGPDGRHGRLGGPELAKQLAAKLGVTEAKVTKALQAVRDDVKPAPGQKPATKPDPAVRDAALAKALAKELGVDEAKVKSALEAIRSDQQTERAAALKTKLDAAVKAGTLTQAEADAVTKAVEKGVIDAH